MLPKKMPQGTKRTHEKRQRATSLNRSGFWQDTDRKKPQTFTDWCFVCGSGKTSV